jgi:hypothetical protein
MPGFGVFKDAISDLGLTTLNRLRDGLALELAPIILSVYS